MSRYLLDTNAMSDLMNRRYEVHLRASEARSRGGILGTCEPVIAELCFGFENSTSPADENYAVLQRTLARLKVWPHDRDASREYGRLVADLKRRGRPIGPMDMLIAAIALSLGDCTVVTNDQDYLVVPALKVENWREKTGAGTP